MAHNVADQPRITTIITAYNSAAYIGEAIESVLAQTQPVDEIVVIDDGSTDDTRAIVEQYAPAGVRYVFQQNQGPGAARNRGIGETTGSLITFLDGDDTWLPDKTERQIAFLATHPEIALVSGAWIGWDVEKDKRWVGHFGLGLSTKQLRREIVVRNVVGNPSMVMLRREVLDQTGVFNSSLRWGQDWEFWMRVVARTEIAFLPDPVIVYRSHAGNISHDRSWERLARLHAISHTAIQSYQPAWERPVLYARAWSRTETFRALYAVKHQFPRRAQVWHAAQALVAYPFDNLAQKLQLVARACLGENFYKYIRTLPNLSRVRRQV